MKGKLKKIFHRKKPASGSGEASTSTSAAVTTDPDLAFSVVERRIQTLTTILYNMNRRHPPHSDRSQIPAFLRHLATLLTYGHKYDADAERVIAVTGSLTHEQLRTLVVTQSPFSSSKVSEFRVKEITKSSGTFEEVVNGDKNADLLQHISDVWAAIDSYNPNDNDQFRSFCVFIVTRCFWKLSNRVSQDRGCWNVSVSKKIRNWTPSNKEIGYVRWIERPQWAHQRLPSDITARMKGRITDKPDGKRVIEWEFSNATLHHWAFLLAVILRQLERTITSTKAARVKGSISEETKGLENVHAWCYVLYLYVHWKEDVVQILLTQTSLKNAFNFNPNDSGPGESGDAHPGKSSDPFPGKSSDPLPGESTGPDPDELAEMLGESGENEGQQVLRHLQSIVAWHAAAKSLLLNRTNVQNLRVGLVEVPPSKSDLMNDVEFIDEYFRRRPASSPEARIPIETIIRENHTRERFTGTIHAEAMLMGLLTYFSHDSSSIYYGDEIEEGSLHILQELIGPATIEKAIAVSKKCCWSCYRLGNLLGNVKLPGSHGVIYPWTPPWIGVDIMVLQDLEKDLWNELHMAINDTILLALSCQSSGSSMILEGDESADEALFIPDSEDSDWMNNE